MGNLVTPVKLMLQQTLFKQVVLNFGFHLNLSTASRSFEDKQQLLMLMKIRNENMPWLY